MAGDEPDAYDVVFSRFLLQHLSQPLDLLRRMWAAVQPGGSLIVEDADHDGWCGVGTIRVGTASWTAPTMTAPGVFYPPGVTTAWERLRFYASRFPLAEVDATYYTLP